MADCKTFADVTREKLQSLKEELRKNGFNPPDGDAGVIEAMGVKISVTYQASGQTLEVCVVEKPAFIPASMVWSRVEAALKS